MEEKVYNWFVKNGNILIQKNEHCISLQLNYENAEYCLLTKTDTEEIIQILTSIAKKIWEDPEYKKVPYTNHHYKKTGDQYSWEIENAELRLKYNETEDAIEIRSKGNSSLNLEVNYVIEIIQALELLS